jgi:hypothetical protein
LPTHCLLCNNDNPDFVAVFTPTDGTKLVAYAICKPCQQHPDALGMVEAAIAVRLVAN